MACACPCQTPSLLQAELLLRAISDVKTAFRLSDDWCQKLEAAAAAAGKQKKVLYVYRVLAGSQAAHSLKPGGWRRTGPGLVRTHARTLGRVEEGEVLGLRWRPGV